MQMNLLSVCIHHVREETVCDQFEILFHSEYYSMIIINLFESLLTRHNKDFEVAATCMFVPEVYSNLSPSQPGQTTTTQH